MAAILDIWVKMMLKRKSDVRIGVFVVDLVEKVYLYLILGALIQKLFFQDGAGGHLGYFGQNDVLASNWCQNRNPRGGFSGKCIYTWF